MTTHTETKLTAQLHKLDVKWSAWHNLHTGKYRYFLNTRYNADNITLPYLLSGYRVSLNEVGEPTYALRWEADGDKWVVVEEEELPLITQFADTRVWVEAERLTTNRSLPTGVEDWARRMWAKNLNDMREAGEFYTE